METMGFGLVRLKILLFLKQHPELDGPAWLGAVAISIGGGGQVKSAVHPALAEVKLESA